ncbi:hypothetical protein RHMOL_Rhmol04G0189500 [Rhododendron molle]|uniref:Uncharacterized protein n=1 Tax=Rhododendron molle TaxID=49168 RepID=A0ACC0P4I2_RHOML|nr:hypothetical protein RHMOL_Rhmol04G0189500 [Rhododendron molle]
MVGLSVLVKIGIGRSSSLFDPLWCDMSNRQFHLNSPLQDSSTQISSFEDSSTSSIMANANENADADANANANEADVRVGVKASDVVMEVIEEESNPFKKKERKKTSAVWNDFQPVTFPDGSQKHQLRAAVSHMILYHEYPFMHMEHVLFNKFMKTATPHWQKISRAVAKNDCTSTYQAQKKKLKTSLKHVGRVSITTDLWKSPGQRIQYMVMTGHYVDEDWKLQKCVLSFCNVPPPHNRVIISDAWNIENKVATITVDNASYNDVALRNLKSTIQLLRRSYLWMVWRVKEILDKNSVSELEYLRSMALKMKGKFDKSWGECNLVMALGVALDPRYKLVLIGFCFPEIYGDKAEQNIAMVHKSLYDLYDEYVVMHSLAYNEQILQQSSTKVCNLSSVSQGKKVAMGKSKYESLLGKPIPFSL